jgi:hypothetical protein
MVVTAQRVLMIVQTIRVVDMVAAATALGISISRKRKEDEF